MRRAFHFAPLRLGDGSTILPGNWGRMVRRHVLQQGPMATAVSLREAIFEQVRAKDFPSRPSRLAACFCLPDSEQAELYRRHAPDGVLHEVEVIDLDPPMLETLTEHTNMAVGQSGFAQFEEKADLYWRGNTSGAGREIVTMSALRVLRPVE